MLLSRYLSRVKIPLTYATIASGLLLGLFFSTISVLLGLLYYWIAYLAFRSMIMKLYLRLPQRLRTRERTATLEFISVLSPVLVFAPFPHVVLFFSALPIMASLGLIGIANFIITFEFALNIPALELGNDYSLIHILLNPVSSVKKLTELLVSNEEKLATLLLPTAEKEALIARQEVALRGLSKHKGAIIDDLDLYHQQLRKLCQGKTQAELEALDIHQFTGLQKLQFDALNHAIKEAKKLEDAYLEACTPEQQTQYKQYRELTQTLNPPHASCTLSANDLKDSSSEDFIILEKRESVNGSFKTADNKTRFFHFEKGFLPLFQRTYIHPVLGTTKHLPPEDPNDRDLLFLPRSSSQTNIQYRYHFYTSVLGHGLSLQLCETIEALNLSLIPALSAQQQAQTTVRRQPSTSQQATSQISLSLQVSSSIVVNTHPSQNSDSTLTAYRNTPPSNVTITNRSIYTTSSIPYAGHLDTNSAEAAYNLFK